LCTYFRDVMKACSKFQMQQFEHRTSNVEYGYRFAQSDHIIETPKVYSHSMFDVGRSFFVLAHSYCLIEYVAFRSMSGQEF